MAARKASKARGRSRARRGRAGSRAGLLAITRVGGEFAGLALLGTSLLAMLALATHSPDDPVLALAPVVNSVGPAGATLSGLLFAGLGWGAMVLVAAVAWVGGRLLMGSGLPPAKSRFWPGSVLLLLSVSSLPPILDGLAPGRLGSPLGGVLGVWLLSWEELLFSLWGALAVSSFALLIGALSVAGISPGHALAAAGRGAGSVGMVAARGIGRLLEMLYAVGAQIMRFAVVIWRRIRQSAARVTVWREQRARRVRARTQARAERKEELDEEQERERRSLIQVGREALIGNEDPAPPARRGDGKGNDQEAFGFPQPVAKPGVKPGVGFGVKPDHSAVLNRGVGGEAGDPAASARARKVGAPDIVDHELERRASPSQESFLFQDEAPRGPFRLPDIGIFQQPPADIHTYDRESLLMNSRILEKKLLDFGVRGRVVRVHPGPVITMYEYEPAPGIKVNKIVALTDDLAMALRAISIRIIAPLPGKSVVGIEIPNPVRETVYIRTMLESESFRTSSSPLMVVMGKDIFGNCVNSDLAKMPHLLVAGATGTGKSVFLNSFLCSLIFRTTPEDLKLLLIDPKLLELSIYEGIPHLIADVVTAPKRAAAALAGIVRKMEERYQMMSAVQVRNVDQFNAKSKDEIAKGNLTFNLRPKPGEVEGEEVEWCHLPYIVVVIDELADLMVLAAKDVEESLQRLAQMARAAGIHLVLATQRPSVDVLTGVIKANFPARVSFQVSSGTDSRTILDQKGADNLLGMGDMLFLPPGTSIVQRLHGSFVTEKEVGEIVAFLRDQGKPVYDEDLIAINQEPTEQESRDEDVDEMFDQAVAIVSETRNASISYIQRRLKIGYNRAARIIEHMEHSGMVGPQEGTKPRTVFLREPSEDDEY